MYGAAFTAVSKVEVGPEVLHAATGKKHGLSPHRIAPLTTTNLSRDANTLRAVIAATKKVR